MGPRRSAVVTTLVLSRHGESEWNARRMLTGWSDPPLSARGEQQARLAGARLAARRVVVDRVYTSALSRATQTARIMMAAAGARSVPVAADWRLNERHLGRLEGLTKAEVAAMWGNERRKEWRDDHLSRPPSLDPEDPDHPRHDPRYRHVPAARLPGAERGCDTAARVLEFWYERVIPDVLLGRSVLVVGHLGPLRVLADRLPLRPSGESTPCDWPHAQPLVCPVAVRRDGDGTGHGGCRYPTVEIP